MEYKSDLSNFDMSSIFLRIYSGILLATIFVIVGLYLGFQFYNEYRLNSYLNSVARGTFTLIAQGISRHSGVKRREWLQVMQRLVGLKLTLIPSYPEDLNLWQRRKLHSGEVLILSDINEQATTLYITIPDTPQLVLAANLVNVNEQLARVAALLILNELGRHPKHSRKGVWIKLRQQFGFPITRLPRAQARLDRAQLRQVDRGDIVVVLNDTTSDNPFIKVFAKYGNSGDLLVLGPISLFNWYPGYLIVMLGSIGLVLLAVYSYILVHPLESRLKHLEKELDKIGTELVPAIELEGNDAISRFAGKVNSMVVRIRGLLEEQKEFTHAISHELRTPVSRMKFRLESLQLNAESGQGKPIIEGMRRDLIELDCLLDELLTLASLEKDTIPYEVQSFDLADLLDRVCEKVYPNYAHLKLSISITSGDGIVVGMEYLLQRALQNLLLNAARYASSRIEIGFQIRKHRFELWVADDGPGIGYEDRGKSVFPFYPAG